MFVRRELKHLSPNKTIRENLLDRVFNNNAMLFEELSSPEGLSETFSLRLRRG